METKIFVIGIPTFDDVVERIGEAFADIFEKPKPRCSKPAEPRWTPPAPSRPIPRPACGCGAPAPEWGIAGEPACENKRFGAEFAIDEPRCEDYDCRSDFEYDHQLYDEFVSAGEDCVARGLARPEGVTPHRCNAVRQPVNCPPPMRDQIPGGELIGETHWWETAGW